MDLVSQIIATKDSVEINEVKSDLDGLSSSAEILYRKIACELDDPRNLLLRRILVKPLDFTQDVRSLLDTAIHLEKRIKELNTRNGLFGELEFVSMIQRIEDITNTLLHLKSILVIESLFRSIGKSLEADIFSASEELMEAKKLINRYIKMDKFTNFFSRALQSYSYFYNTIKMIVIKNWNNSIIFKKVQIGKKTISSSLSILNLPNSEFKIFQLLKIPFENDFKQNFLNDILIPILNHTCSVKVHRSFTTKAVLTVNYSKKSPKMALENVIDCLIIIFNIINTELNLQSDISLSFIRAIGIVCSNEFISLLMQQHLSDIMDATDNDHIILSINKLISVMKEKGFIIKDNKLNDFTSNLHLSREKIYLNCNKTALNIIEENLFDMERTKPVVFPHFKYMNMTTCTSLVNSAHTQFEWLLDYDSAYLPDRFQIFPECQISKSIDKLVKLLENILNEASSSEPNVNAILLESAHQIISNYVSKSQSQPSTPLHSAVVFNNSIYLMTSLIDLGNDNSAGFSSNSFISKLQELGFSALNQQVLLQQNILIESVHKSGLGKLNELEESSGKTESIINDCLKQLVSLQKMWFDVLPSDIYCMIMGHLCNVLIDEMLSMISSASNQTGVDVVNQLHYITSSVSQKIILLFVENHPVEKMIKNWSKLNETAKLLSWTLPTVKDRWDKGKGPLTTYFNAHQLKALITAVYPQSDIRHQTLASIV